MLEFGAELEVDFGIKYAWILCGFLQDETKGLKLLPDFDLLGFQILLNLLLDGRNGLLNLRSTDLVLLLLRVKRHASQQLLHQAHKSLVLHLFGFDVLQGFDQLVGRTRLHLDLFQHSYENCLDVVFYRL